MGITGIVGLTIFFLLLFVATPLLFIINGIKKKKSDVKYFIVSVIGGCLMFLPAVPCALWLISAAK